MNRVVPMKSIASEVAESQVSPLQALKNLAPSVFTLESAPVVSEKYRHVTTSDIIQHLSLKGWTLDKVGETRISRARRERGLAPYVAHAVSLRHPDFKLGKLKTGDIVPNILIGGSHDRSSAFWMNGGIYRCVCDNQMVVAMGQNFASRFAHKGSFTVLMENIYRAIDTMVDRSGLLTKSVGRWSSIMLTNEQRYEYYRRIIGLRPESTSRTMALTNADLFDERRRPEDKYDDLFTIYQVAQEHTVVGLRATVAIGNGRLADRMISRGVGGVNPFIDLNKKMWSVTEEYANELTHA